MYFDAEQCGQRVREQIKVSGYTQEEFAEKVHISLAHLKYIMSGNRRFSMDTLVEIACTLDVSIDYLLLGQERRQVEARNKLLSVIGELSAIAREL
ncbi:MAG: helix-turn-helix transcriptional regulator [Eubacteriales bacterium]|nr:helix-turn-helix transcriptional regulator [Eubacteriales bacterium]